jgi:polyisoprenoid-binding protein YceI
VPPAGAVALVIDPARSELTFTIHRPGETIDGRAHDFSGEARLDPERPDADTSVVLRVRGASLETGNRLRDRKMRNAHLETGRFPEILFRSTAIRLAPEGAAAPPLRPGEERRAVIEGVLSLHGVDRAMMFPAAIRYDNATLTATGEVGVRLTDHSIPIPRFLWIVLDDEVRVRFRFTAARGGPGA